MMKKTIIAGVVVSALTASSAFAIEGGLASQNGFPAALEEIKTALNDPNGAQFARAQDVAMRRLGLNFNDAEVFVSAVRSGKDVSHFGEQPFHQRRHTLRLLLSLTQRLLLFR
ncbi:hypothetical protein ACNPM5_09635 [Enterobacter hormaechei]|uniref:hypothetical protein n=2 Tax=Enterobacter hormaechei TaxID=158836 RepID=UPI000F9B236D|nr:hypothetical protein EKN51_01340 [Enterobacter hormaechei]HBL4917719.1 hypothetical protein [Enterobacter hormaechei]